MKKGTAKLYTLGYILFFSFGTAARSTGLSLYLDSLYPHLTHILELASFALGFAFIYLSVSNLMHLISIRRSEYIFTFILCSTVVGMIFFVHGPSLTQYSNIQDRAYMFNNSASYATMFLLLVYLMVICLRIAQMSFVTLRRESNPIGLSRCLNTFISTSLIIICVVLSSAGVTIIYLYGPHLMEQRIMSIVSLLVLGSLITLLVYFFPNRFHARIGSFLKSIISNYRLKKLNAFMARCGITHTSYYIQQQSQDVDSRLQAAIINIFDEYDQIEDSQVKNKIRRGFEMEPSEQILYLVSLA